MSKGSQPRKQRDDAAYRDGWEAIFGKVSQWTGKITFPAQTCGNCKHWIDGCCESQEVTAMCRDRYGFMTLPDFGCNKWETKE